MAASSSTVLSNADLVRDFLTYLSPLELLEIQLVSHFVQGLVLERYNILFNDPFIKYMCYKQFYKYKTPKQAVCYLYKRSSARSDTVLIFGSCFGAPSYSSVTLTLTERKISAKASSAFALNRGSHAVAMSSDGCLYAIGGFDSTRNTSLNGVRSLSLDRCSNKSSREHSLQLEEGICFAAATTTLTGDIVMTGGCSNPFQFATVFNSCRLLNTTMKLWETNRISPMLHPRCGHQLVTLFDGKLLAIGGYRGVDTQQGHVYQQSAEMWDWETCTWTQLSSDMKVPRSGFAACVGPAGAVYVAGGSTNGSLGTKCFERWDPREGRWTELPPTQLPRGYTAGCLTYSGCFCISGGLHDGKVQAGLECFDFRANRWFSLGGYPGETNLDTDGEALLSWANFPQECVPIPVSRAATMQFLRSAHHMVLVP